MFKLDSDPSQVEHTLRHKRMLRTLLACGGLLLCCSFLLVSLGRSSAHASSAFWQAPVSPSEKPPDLAVALSHAGADAVAPGGTVTFTIGVTNAATGGPVINGGGVPNFLVADTNFPA